MSHVIGTAARDVACSTCDAQPGGPCTSYPSGEAMTGYHPDRVAAAMKVTREANATARHERTRRRTDGT